MQKKLFLIQLLCGLWSVCMALILHVSLAFAGDNPANNPSMLEDRERRLDTEKKLYEQSVVPHVFNQVANMKNDNEDSGQYEMVFTDWTFGSVLEDQEESSGLKTKQKSTLTPSNWSSIRNAGDWRVNS